MSHRAHGFVNVSNEGDNLTSEPQTLEMMVLATVPSTHEAELEEAFIHKPIDFSYRLRILGHMVIGLKQPIGT